MISLRPYQSKAIDDLRAALSRHRSALCVAPTGSGKTLLAAFMLGSARQRGRSAWFIAHRDFLLDQTALTFAKVGIPYGFLAAGRAYDPGSMIQIVSIGTAQRRLDKLEPPDIIVWDEAHHIPAAGYRKVYQWASTSRHIGLSATPARLDGKGLDEFFDELVSGPSVAALMREGYLSQYRAFAPSLPNLAGVHTVAGDYHRGELSHAMDQGVIIGNMVQNYRERANGTRAVYFGVGIAHSQNIAGAFNAAGINAVHIDGTTPTAERSAAAEAFADGRLSVLCNCDIFGEGFDLSSQINREVPIETVGLARPTQSIALHLQQIGRALRPKDRPAIILDHAGNLMKHGLPDDERKWSLQGVERRKRAAAEGPAVTRCKECFGVYRAVMVRCPHCGAFREVERREIREVSGVLQEIDIRAREWQAQDWDRKREQSSARTETDLIRLAMRRGYRNPAGWAYYVMKARARG